MASNDYPPWLFAVPDKKTNQLAERDARQLLTSCADDQFVETLRVVLKTYRIDRWLTINQAAALADMSVRSFQRKLEEHGETYARLCDATKAEIAIHQLRFTDHSLGEIGSGLGYTERTNFIRAFKRWTGHTPEQFRSDDSTRSNDSCLMRTDEDENPMEAER